MRVKIFLLILIIMICPALKANDGFWDGVGTVASFGKSFWADSYSTAIRAEMAYATNSPDYDWGEFDAKYRPFVFANLGADIPVWSGNFKADKYGLSITLPFMMELWYDRFEWVTSPIIDTAYRFGVFDTVFIYRLDTPKPVLKFLRFNIYNWAVKLSLLKHESTHLGDELTIYRKDKEFPVTRTDVIMNYAELVFTLNDPDNQPRVNHGFKFGFLFNWNFKKGWYSILASEAAPDLVKHTNIPIEIYLQYQYQSALFSKGFQIIGSAEYRLRERHKAPYYTTDGVMHTDGPNLANCFNFFAGIRYDNQKRNYFSKTGIGAHYYLGINPYGQFRSMPYFRQWGLALFFE